MYSAVNTWHFRLKFATPVRKGSNFLSLGTDDSKIPVGCPGEGDVETSNLYDTLLFGLGLHILPFWKRLCQGLVFVTKMRCKTRHSVKLKVMIGLTDLRRTHYELVTFIKLKKRHASYLCHFFTSLFTTKKINEIWFLSFCVIDVFVFATTDSSVMNEDLIRIRCSVFHID